MDDDVRLRFGTLVLLTLGSGFVGGVVALGGRSLLEPAPAVVEPAPSPAPTASVEPPPVAAPLDPPPVEALEPKELEAPDPLPEPEPEPPLEPVTPFETEPLADGPPFSALDTPLATQSEFMAKTRKEARAGDVDAMLRLADWMTTEHSQVTFDEVKASVWYRRALFMAQSVRGYLRVKAALEFAELLIGPRDPHRANPSAAVPLLEAALEEPDATPSQRFSVRLLLAHMQEKGIGMPADPAAAYAEVADVAEAALLIGEKNHVTESACETLAGMLRAGIGCQQDVAAAALWYRRAIEASTLRMDQDLVPLLEIYTKHPELEGAAEWLAENGKTPQALFALGRIHETGQGVPKDDRKAAAYYRRAAKAGHAFAKTYLTSVLRRRPELIEAEAE